MTYCLSSQTVDLHLTTEGSSEQALPSVMGPYRRNLISPFFKCIEIGLWIKVCTCCAYCTGMEEKLAYQTGSGWYLPIYLGQVAPRILFKNWPQHHKRAIKVSVFSVFIGKAFQDSMPSILRFAFDQLIFLSLFIYPTLALQLTD